MIRAMYGILYYFAGLSVQCKRGYYNKAVDLKKKYISSVPISKKDQSFKKNAFFKVTITLMILKMVSLLSREGLFPSYIKQ